MTKTAKNSSKSSHGTYLIRTPYSYCFRYRIPPDLSDVVGKTEIRYSLKTGYIGKAKPMALQLAGQMQRLCVDLRDINSSGAGDMPEEISQKRMQALIAGWVKETLNEDEKERIRPTKKLNEDSVDDKFNGFDWVQTDHRRALAFGQHVETVGHTVDILLEEQGITIDKDSDSYHQLCRDMLKASIRVFEIEKERTYGDYSSGTDEEVVVSILPSPEPPPMPTTTFVGAVETDPSISLQDLITEYQNERVKAGRWSKGTIRNYRPLLAIMTQYLGAETMVNTITRQQMLEYKKLLASLPPGFARLKAYKDIAGLTPQDLEGKHDKQMDITTLRTYIQMAESVFSFGVRNGYMKMNPAEGLKPPKKKHAREQRQAFDDEDLQNLFQSGPYLNDLHTKPYQFWLPVLGLYTGCRLEELCQLYVEDVTQKDDIWCLDINTDKDKSLKNEASDRMVPLHPVLVDVLDFPGFVDRVKRAGQERVFQELKKQSGDYGHYASRWFARFKKKAGIDMTPNKKVFHSFRHNFTDFLYKGMVMETIIEELTGRAGKTETR